MRILQKAAWAGIPLLLVVLFCAAPVYSLEQKAAVQTTASDWSSAAQAVVNADPVGGPRPAQLDLFARTTTDFMICSYGQYFYLIGRYMTDTITKFHIDAPTVPIYQVSVADGGATSNPYDMVFVNADKAFMPMYELDKCWIINPRDGSKTGELDLSAYAGTDGIPEMCAGVIAHGKLFLLMQRLDRDAGWTAPNQAYLAVFDAATNQEIDTTGGVLPGGLKGIELPGRNTQSMQYLPENDTIYIGATGLYPDFHPGSTELYTGGVITVNPETYAANLLIDDGPAGPDGDHPYGVVTYISVASPTNGYFVGYKGWGDNYLYNFNPETGDVAGSVAALDGKNLMGNPSWANLDKNGLLWISSGGTDHSVFVLNPEDNTVDEQVDTNMNPGTLAFCPQTIWPGSNKVNSTTGTGQISVSPDQGALTNQVAHATTDYPAAQGFPEGKIFVDGLISFDIEGLPIPADPDPGVTVQVTIEFPSAFSTDAAFYRIGADGNYYPFDPNLITRVDGHTVIIELTDGGYGDKDGVKDGTIKDPFGWAGTPTPDPTPVTGGGDSSSGCFVESLLH